MKTITPGITVNGIRITPEEIGVEVQYHPAESLPEAKRKAMTALVIREFLVQRASELGLCQSRDDVVQAPDEVIDTLLDQEISIPEADTETCQRYYQQNKSRFKTSPLFDVSHILYLAPLEDEDQRQKAKEQAERAIQRLKESSEYFEVIAKEESACSSAKDGGRLGQIVKGQTMPAFEAALWFMQEGELSASPVETEVGFHVIKVHKRAEAKQLPFEAVEGWIKDHLKQESWNRAFHQYIQLLAGRFKVSGFRFEGVSSPLVQ